MSAGVSRGGDMTGIDRYDRLQQPTLNPVDDLTRFVAARIIEVESGTRETFAVHDEPNGAMAHRYAGAVRRDMVAFRRIVAEYVDDVDPVRSYAFGVAVRAIAMRWADHPDFKAEWRIQ